MYIHEIIDIDTDDTNYDAIILIKDRSREDRLRHKNAEKLRIQWGKKRCAVDKVKTAKKEKRELRRSR